MSRGMAWQRSSTLGSTGRPIVATLVALAAALVALVPAGRSSAAATYTIIDLGTLGGGYSVATGINGRGEVVGYSLPSTTSGLLHAFLYDASGMHDLGTLPGGTYSVAEDLNDAGQVVGWANSVAGGVNRPVLWEAGTMRDLGTLGGSYGTATAINAAGAITGWSGVASSDAHAFLYEDGSMRDLGGTSSIGYGINGLGHVAGGSAQAPVGHAVVWEDGVLRDLGGLGGASAAALDVNDAGQAVGTAERADGSFEPFLADAGGIRSLGTFGGSFAEAWAINNRGDIVGDAAVAAGGAHAFLYRDGVLADLNDLVVAPGWELVSANDINEAGQIVGYGSSPNGEEHAFLLTPGGLPPSELDLARAFRPHLLFDDTELWRPISLDALLAERVNGTPAHQVCHPRRFRRDLCRDVTSTADLLAFEAENPGNNSLDIRGDQRSIQPGGSVDAGYAAPSLAGCAIPAARDCDSGPSSVIYYNRTVGEGLDGEAGARSYWDYWYFFRYNHSPFSLCRFGVVKLPGGGPQLCFEHEGDWEGVTVVTSIEPAPPTVYWVAYAAHERWYRYAAEALQQAGRLDGTHVKAYVASGSHAAYPRPCERVAGLCPQQELLVGSIPRPDGAYDGEIPWSRNLDELCETVDSCVRPLPELDFTPATRPTGNAADWNAWPGRWGRSCSQALSPECTRAEGPRSPGLQARYLDPWNARLETRIPASVDRAGSAAVLARIRAEAQCGSWFGPSVTALACDELALRRTLALNTFDRRGSVSVRLNQPRSGTASFPGLTQVIGRPLREGDVLSVSVNVRTAARGSLWLRIQIGAVVASARFELAKLVPSGRFRVELRDPLRRPRIALRSEQRRIPAASVLLPLQPPLRLEARRQGGALLVSFVATDDMTAIWLLGQQGRLVSTRSLATVAGRPTRVVFPNAARAFLVVAATGTSAGGYSWPRTLRPIQQGGQRVSD